MKLNFWKTIKSEASVWRVGLIPGLAVTTTVVLARLTGLLQVWELQAFDTFLRLRPPEPIDERIVIISIDDQDIQQVGRYPIPDRDLAALVKKIQTYQPVAIGLDLVRDVPYEPGHADLVAVYRSSKNLIGVEQSVPSEEGTTFKAPPELPAEQVGFADVVVDPIDYRQRRILLGTPNAQNEFRFSLAIRLAERYLARKHLPLDNGIDDLQAMRFGIAELPRFQPNTGSYVGEDAGGVQTLLNVRSGLHPFRILSFRQMMAGRIDPDWIRDRIVLVGVRARSAKDEVTSDATPTARAGLVYGVDMHAHATSQIVSAALDGRPLIQVWSDGWEYLWIIGWGLIGISLGAWRRSVWKSLGLLILISAGLMAGCYLLLLAGWWVPVVPALLVLLLNGAGPAAIAIYHYEQDLRNRLKERQLVIERTFNTIHNGPLQTLAGMLKDAEIKDLPNLMDLHHLNQELRAVYEMMRQEGINQGNRLHVNATLHVDFQAPLHEILHEVYRNTMERDFPGFKTIKFTVVKFEPLNTRRLNLEQKQRLCQFLEEALCNVGRHASNVTRLNVICTQEGKQQVIRVADNGSSNPQLIFNQPPGKAASGFGTQQAKKLAKMLGGKFRRYPNDPQGTVCELTWSATRFWFW
ncbi:CHASE2 domain-containing protein [Kovacikia minuta CCNUW1]|uniref:sensor histidine kinase n=1 Tax=Kovacikia minuta TaxID=2931930 RepID=UPI001CCE4265|nr:CHASE2 domain-containing protein [Kovacikia minuta]UBF25623.1 CHASE2 domain-containing protein [Kovacikia minuta CCNUW1]